MLKFRKPNFSRRWELAASYRLNPQKRADRSHWPHSRRPWLAIITGQIARIYFELEVTW
jgi:hypothetical protein